MKSSRQRSRLCSVDCSVCRRKRRAVPEGSVMSLRTGTMDGAIRTPPSSAKAMPAVAQTVGPTPAAVPSVEDEREELSLSLVATILEAGERLRLPQETTATAVTIFHRFFNKRNVLTYARDGRLDVVVTTCVFLAAKVEENPRRLRDAINIIHFLRARQRTEAQKPSQHQEQQQESEKPDTEEPPGNGIPKLDKEYWSMKEKIVDTEQLILRVLGFDIETFQAYRFLLNYCRSLRCPSCLVEVAWVFVTDSLFSPRACLEMRPQAIACSAIYLAHLATKDKLLLVGNMGEYAGLAEGRRGWAVFGVRSEEVEACSTCLLGLYERRRKRP